MSSKKKKKKKPKWSRSAGKYYLEEDLRTGAIDLDATPKDWQDIMYQRPEFIDFDGPRLFQGRLARARTRTRSNKNSSAEESAALARDRLVYPKQATNHRGEPQWEGSPAQSLLQKDVKEGKHLTQKPHELQQTRPEYLLFPLSVFRGHIYQEERLQKWLIHRRRHNKTYYNLPDSP